MGNPHYASVSRGHVFSQQVVNRVLGRDPPLERHATRTGNLEAIAVGSDAAHPGDEAGRASGGLPRSGRGQPRSWRPADRRTGTVSWTAHVICLTLRGSFGRATRAWTVLPPWTIAGSPTISQAPSRSVKRSPMRSCIAKSTCVDSRSVRGRGGILLPSRIRACVDSTSSHGFGCKNSTGPCKGEG